MAVIDRGVCRFRTKYKHLQVDQQKWIRMTSKQRELHLRTVATTVIVGALDNLDLVSSQPPPTDYTPLACTPEQANLANVPLATAHGIWTKAKELLTTPCAVINGPSLQKSGPQTVIVASKSGTKPHVVTRKSRGVLLCDSSCPNWAMLRFCSHS